MTRAAQSRGREFYQGAKNPMKIVSILTALGVLAAAAIPAALPAEAGNVRGYYRKNGTYVAPHYRTNPDGYCSNNLHGCR